MTAKRKGRKASRLPYVICRCSAAGVHAGYLVSRKGDEATLRDARRLWEWRVPMGKGSFLNGVALHGLGENCRVGEPVPITLIGVCEIIDVTDAARQSIEGYAHVARSK